MLSIDRNAILTHCNVTVVSCEVPQTDPVGKYIECNGLTGNENIYISNKTTAQQTNFLDPDLENSVSYI
jgi:hypothetical protein